MELTFEDTRVAFAGKTDLELRRAQLLFASIGSRWVVQSGSTVAAALLRMRVPGMAAVIRSTIFAQFCGGESLAGCEGVVAYLGRGGVKAILDYSVEGEKSEAGFDATLGEILSTLEWAHSRPLVAFGVFKVTGLGRHGLLEKRSRGAVLSPDEEAEWSRARGRVEQICERAHALGVRVLLDAEESWIQGAIDALADEMMARFNRERAIVYNTYQLYRRDALATLDAAWQRASAAGFLLGAKLVRGAYLEKERRRAAELGYPDPTQPDKASTDADYDRAIAFCVEHLDRVALCAGTHNESSSMLLVQEMERRGVAPDDARVFFSQLLGMSDNISFNLARAGYNVAKYVPYGPVRSVLPYLVRRAQENTAIAGQGSRELRLIEREQQRRRRDPSAGRSTAAGPAGSEDGSP
jgi:proline dehydrogenase